MPSKVPIRAFSHRLNSIEMSSTSETVNAVEQLRKSGLNVVDLGPGEPPFATPEHIKQAAIGAIHNDKTKYTAVCGMADLREAIVRRHHLDFGSNYSLEEVIACPGGKYALFMAMQILMDEGDEAVIPTPTWVSFKDMVRFAGGRCVFVDTTQNDFVLAPETVERALTRRTKVIVLNFPNNPSGALIDATSLERIVEIAASRNIWVVADECYVYLNFVGKPLSVAQVMRHASNVVIVGSLSKTYAMTGWRLGYALAPAPVISAMQTLQSQEISCPTSVTQIAGIAALTGPQDCVELMRQEYAQLRDQAVAGLKGLPGIRTVTAEGAFFLFPDVSGQLQSLNLQTAREFSLSLLRECGVVVVPGEGFGSATHVRLAYSVSKYELARGIQKLREFCLAHQG
ncbi:MAG TPA: pyridoxal phosphate-dependent aminotransferase [Candidatus Acidoferrales bacterium]|nr:pyridoxal phosphate-dependent aminotransferase [Candidatus Acidoferrales bacterium]